MVEKAIAFDTDVVGVTPPKLPLCRNRLGLFLKQWSTLELAGGAGRGRILVLAARLAAAWANERKLGLGEKLNADGGEISGGVLLLCLLGDGVEVVIVVVEEEEADWLSNVRLMGIGFRFLR